MPHTKATAAPYLFCGCKARNSRQKNCLIHGAAPRHYFGYSLTDSTVGLVIRAGDTGRELGRVWVDKSKLETEISLWRSAAVSEKWASKLEFVVLCPTEIRLSTVPYPLEIK